MKTLFSSLLVSLLCLGSVSFAQFNFTLVKDIRPLGPLGSNSSGPNGFDTLNNKIFFLANHDDYGVEIWMSDGTEQGTQLLKDINPNPGGSSIPGKFFRFQNKFYFVAYDGAGYGLWETDGTPTGTVLFNNTIGGLYYFISFSNRFFFVGSDVAHGTELWVSDGTQGGTQLFKDLFPGPDNSYPARFTVMNNNAMIFTAITPSGDDGLWITDGTPGGTQFITDPYPGSANGWAGFTVMNNKVYFRTDDGVHGSELWVTDGTLSGTQMVIDIAPGIQGSTPDGIVTDGNRLYFSAYDGQTHQVEPWISDGTALGTVLLKDINPAGSSNPETFIPFNGKVVFAANNGSVGREVWLTDGTTSGTVLLKDITPGFSGGCSIPFSAVNNNLLFFPGCDGSSNGPDLWVSDLTSANTIKIAPPNSTTSATLMNANSFGVFNNELYVGAMFDTSGIELWKVSGSFTGLSPKTIGRLNIYPNPATNQINVLGLKTGEWIQVYNMQGQLVLTHQVENAALSISTENWTSGLYLLKSSSQSSLISIQKH